MNLDDMKETRARLNQIERLVEELEKAQRTLKCVNEYVKSGSVWRPELCVRARTAHWTDDSITVRVPVPAGVIQQSAINEVVRLKRELNLLGYEWPAARKP